MRIGIDCRTMLNWKKTGEAAGIGHYTYYLAKYLLQEDKINEYVLFLDRYASQRLRRDIIGDNPRASIRTFPFQALQHCLPFGYGHMAISAMFERANLDLLHAPANALPLFFRKPAVITVHDLAIYDHPEWFPMEYPDAPSFAERVIMPYSVKTARRIIAVSRRTRDDLVRIFRAPDGKIDVVYEGVEPPAPVAASDAILKRLHLRSGRYCLCLGTIEPRKNIAAAVRAFVLVVKNDYRRFQDLDLAIAGRKGWGAAPAFEAMNEGNAALAAAAEAAGLEPHRQIRHVGYLSHQAKVAVIGGAAAFVFPSFYEGFGLPVIEAMSLGVPVIASDRASLPEICGDAAALVNPEDDENIAAALRRALTEPDFVAELREKGRQRASEFTWRRTAQETIKVYEKAVGSLDTSFANDLP